MADRNDVVAALSRVYGGKRKVVLSSGAISGYGHGSAWGSNSPSAPFEGSAGVEASALFSRLDALGVPAANERKTAIDRCIKALITCGAWAKRDAYYLIGANELTWRQNWKQNAYNLTLVGAPTFVPDSYAAGNGTATAYDTGFNPATEVGAKYQQNDCSMFVWSKSDLANAGAISYEIGNPNAWIGRNATVAGQTAGRRQTSSTGGVSAGSFPGAAGWSRSAAAVWEGYARGFETIAATDASAALSNSTFRVCMVNAVGFGLNQVQAAWFGGDVTPAEILGEQRAIRRYLQDIGAQPISIAAYGDSTAVAIGSTNWTTNWYNVLGNSYGQPRIALSRGVSGASTADMLAKVQADGPHFSDQIVIFMDWTNTGELSASAIANFKAAAAACGSSKWFVMPPAQDAVAAPQTNIAEVQAALLSDPYFAGHTLGTAAQASYLAAVSGAGTRIDDRHFNDGGQVIQATYIKAFMDGAGW